MRAAGVETIDELRRRSVEDIDWYWDLVVKDLGIPFDEPYTRVRDSSRGIEWTTWFVDGRLNVATACVDRWRADPEVSGLPAVIYEDEPGETRQLTYAELAQAVDRAAAGLRGAGIGKGDAVGVLLPMTPGGGDRRVRDRQGRSAVRAAVLGLRRDGDRLATQRRAGQARVHDRMVVASRPPHTAESGARRGATRLPDRAYGGRRRPRGDPDTHRTGRDVSWSEFAPPVDGPVPAEPTSAEDVLLLGYTSGTTGKPKGAVHTHAGLPRQGRLRGRVRVRRQARRRVLLAHRHGLGDGAAEHVRDACARGHAAAVRRCP